MHTLDLGSRVFEMHENPEANVPGTRVVQTTDELTKAFTRLAEAIERQAQAIDTLAHVIASQYVEEGEQAEPATYLDGSPKFDG